LAGLCIPHSDIVQGACGKQVAILIGERNTVDALIMACVTQLWVDLVSVTPIDGGFCSATEEMGRVSCQ